MIIFNIAIVVILLLCFGQMSFMILRSHQSLATVKSRFFLPISYFNSLVVLLYFWMILCMIVGASVFMEQDQQIIVIIASLLAPFFSWWRHKKSGF